LTKESTSSSCRVDLEVYKSISNTSGNGLGKHVGAAYPKAFNEHLAELVTKRCGLGLVEQYHTYVAVSVQRSVLFWDTLRQTVTKYLEHERAGKPPVLHFDYEVVLDAASSSVRSLCAAAHCAPKGVTVDPKRLAYMCCPRAGMVPASGVQG